MFSEGLGHGTKQLHDEIILIRHPRTTMRFVYTDDETRQYFDLDHDSPST